MAESSQAPNRFSALAIILHSQKRLLALEASDRNREALFRTCSELAEAPDDYAGHLLAATPARYRATVRFTLHLGKWITYDR